MYCVIAKENKYNIPVGSFVVATDNKIDNEVVIPLDGRSLEPYPELRKILFQMGYDKDCLPDAREPFKIK